jgi:hypothetical protein
VYTEGSAPGPIPWSAIALYAEKRGLEPDVSQAFEMILYEMDGAFIKWYLRRKKASTPKAPKPTLKKGKR